MSVDKFTREELITQLVERFWDNVDMLSIGRDMASVLSAVPEATTQICRRWADESIALMCGERSQHDAGKVRE